MADAGPSRAPPPRRSLQRLAASAVRPSSWGVGARILLALLLVGVVPTLLMAPVQLLNVESRLIEQSRAMLVQLSLVQQRRIGQELRRMELQSELIASRTQMRISLDEFNRQGSESAREFIGLVLSDALAQSGGIEGLWIYGQDDTVVSSVGSASEATADPLALLPAGIHQSFHLQVFWPERGDVCDAAFWLSTPLRLNEFRIGTLVAKLGLDEIQLLLQDFPQPELIGESFILMERAGNPGDCALLAGGLAAGAVSLDAFLGARDLSGMITDVPDNELVSLQVGERTLMLIALPLDYGIGRLYVKSTPKVLSRLRDTILASVHISIILTVVLAGLMSVWLARRIAAPAKALAKAVGQIRDGAGLTPLDSHRWPRELVDLANAVRDSDAAINRNTNALRQEIRRRRVVQAQLHNLANTDELTGLANRRQFMEQLGATLANPGQDLPPAELVYLDLDGFKPVNDEYGHEVGDEVLKTVADRIRHLVREGDLAARLGGDEFAVLYQYLDEAVDGEPVANRLEAAIAQPMQIGEESIQVGCSVGRIQLTPDMDVRSALRLADQAMYKVKRDKGRRRSDPAQNG